MPSRLQIALPDIRAILDGNQKAIYQKRGLSDILTEYRQNWRLAQHTTTDSFINELLKCTKLHKVVLASESGYDEIVRYTWGPFSPYQLALSLKPEAYLSHGSAVFLHALNDQIPKTIYINKEQTPKPARTGPLTQEAIDRAFSSRQRSSTYTFTHENYRYVLLSGKHTGRLEVSDLPGPSGEALQTTKLERTLIDIAVRPSYAGGVYQVLEAYAGARDRVSVNTLIAVLGKLSYKYPYHQSIGFYMTRAGYENRLTERFKTPGIHFNFYLDYGMPDHDYDPEWRLFFPKGM